MSRVKRALVVGAASLAMMPPTTALAAVQPEPPDTHCYPLSVLCGFQVGPIGPNDFDFFPGGSLFPPAPPEPGGTL